MALAWRCTEQRGWQPTRLIESTLIWVLEQAALAPSSPGVVVSAVVWGPNHCSPSPFLIPSMIRFVLSLASPRHPPVCSPFWLTLVNRSGKHMSHE